MKFVNVQKLKSKTSEVLQTIEKEGVIVTYRGKPKAIIQHFTENDMEDYVIAKHPDFRASLEEAYQEFWEGKVTDLDILIRETEKEIKNAGV